MGEGEKWTDRDFRRFATAQDVAEEAERLCESGAALVGEALAAVAVAVRDGAIGESEGVSIGNRLRALQVEVGETAKAMASASASARRGDK